MTDATPTGSIASLRSRLPRLFSRPGAYGAELSDILREEGFFFSLLLSKLSFREIFERGLSAFNEALLPLSIDFGVELLVMLVGV